jgi:hypothetical protein
MPQRDLGSSRRGPRNLWWPEPGSALWVRFDSILHSALFIRPSEVSWDWGVVKIDHERALRGFPRSDISMDALGSSWLSDSCFSDARSYETHVFHSEYAQRIATETALEADARFGHRQMRTAAEGPPRSRVVPLSFDAPPHPLETALQNLPRGESIPPTSDYSRAVEQLVGGDLVSVEIVTGVIECGTYLGSRGRNALVLVGGASMELPASMVMKVTQDEYRSISSRLRTRYERQAPAPLPPEPMPPPPPQTMTKAATLRPGSIVEEAPPEKVEEVTLVGGFKRSLDI